MDAVVKQEVVEHTQAKIDRAPTKKEPSVVIDLSSSPAVIPTQRWTVEAAQF